MLRVNLGRDTLESHLSEPEKHGPALVNIVLSSDALAA